MEMRKYIIKLNGRVYEVEMGEVSGSGYTAPAPVASAAAPAASAAPAPTAPAASAAAPAAPAAPTAAPAAPAAPAAGGEAIVAPMPGNIINIQVKVGDVVKKNQVLVVLEAMKMENEIVAPKDGTVLSIAATRGAAVNVSEELIRIG